MTFSKPKGTYDVLPDESGKWQFVESVVREVARVYHAKEIRTPIFESSELYHRAAGETSDVVSKETYDFEDRGGRGITLRPEGTAGVVRSFIENKSYVKSGTQKMFYMGPMFRYERQQKGRYRQHMQFGVEAFGSDSPSTDVEIIAMACLVLQKLGLDRNVKVKLNSLGSDKSRALYREALIHHFEAHKGSLCSDCQVRFEKNPLRILDCKKDADSEAMKKAPAMIDHLVSEDLAYFNAVKKGLKEIGVVYEYDQHLVRGFDYYTHTIFEVQADIPGFGAQTTLCGGGRYDKLVEELGGPATPGIGFGMGLERVLLALEAAHISHDVADAVDLFFLPMGEDAQILTLDMMRQFRAEGLSCEADFSDRKLKARFKLADDHHAKYTVVVGDDERATQMFKVKDAKTGEQVTVKRDELVKFIQGRV
ncbi:MAG: histidine--tRNA ligase [Defluviitaleaceae bacterium]|nr:histidine--tRNA ligase [Defluviitaleaceae bacterium]